MSKIRERQTFMRYYKEETGAKEVNMKELAKFAVKKGWKLPMPAEPLDILAKQFADAAREEIKHDTVTGEPYRVNHAVTTRQGNEQITIWIDIDEAPRPAMHKSLVQRREQMVGDGLQLTLDADHWNRKNSGDEPIQMLLDLTPDVEWRMNAPKAS
jgi:hypothetical protein